MNPQMSFLREDAARTERWQHLTEGLPNYQQKVMETLLDNTQAFVEGRIDGLQEVNLGNGETTTGNVAVFTRLARPILRRLMPALIANRIVSIQPMTMPTMKVFYIDFKYGTDLAPTAKGDRVDFEQYTLDANGHVSAAAVKRNKWFASGVVRGEVVGVGDGTATTFSLDWYPIKPDSLVVRVDSVEVSNYTIDEETGVIVFAAAPAAAASITADYGLVMEGLGAKGNAQIPEIYLDMSSAAVEVETKKLKARWTIESDQDFMAYHGVSVEEELTEQMAQEIRLEIDRLIIDDLVAAASAGNVNFSKAIPAGKTAKEHAETLLHAIGDASTLIFKKRMRHANFIIMSPDNASYLDKINSFRQLGWGSDGATTQVQIAAGPNVFGTLANRYTVIVDPLLSSDKVLVGYKGNTWQETGYVYAPYVVFHTKTFIDPNHMVPVKGLMTRFARHLVSGDFYATVTVGA
jgi:hypothetical protein